MSHLAFQRYVAVLCLVMVGLCRIVLPLGVVLCQDQGGGRVELGCAKTDDGSCVTACDANEHAGSQDHVPLPCQDNPIESDPAIAKAPPRMGDLTHLAVLAVVPVVSVEVDQRWPVIANRHPFVADPRPPDDIVRLRTVVLLV